MGLVIKENIQKSKAQAEFASLLTYGCFYNESTVFHKDGGFSAHFLYTAKDIDSSTAQMLDSAAYSVMQALNLLDDGWMVETNVISQPIHNESHKNHFQSVDLV